MMRVTAQVLCDIRVIGNHGSEYICQAAVKGGGQLLRLTNQGGVRF